MVVHCDKGHGIYQNEELGLIGGCIICRLEAENAALRAEVESLRKSLNRYINSSWTKGMGT